jgi:hypothetical protein
MVIIETSFNSLVIHPYRQEKFNEALGWFLNFSFTCLIVTTLLTLLPRFEAAPWLPGRAIKYGAFPKEEGDQDYPG